jgi:SAM-dependent methyltransferase
MAARDLVSRKVFLASPIAGSMLPQEDLVEPRLLEPLADRIRIQAGRFPGTEVLDLGSPEGYVGREIAGDAPSWTVYTTNEVDEAPDNLETVTIDGFGDLGFEDDQLAALVGVWIQDPIQAWKPSILTEWKRVLAPAGRLMFLFRGPGSRNPDAPRQLPSQAVAMLEDAGFEHAAERRLQFFPDGSDLLRLRAVKPE